MSKRTVRARVVLALFFAPGLLVGCGEGTGGDPGERTSARPTTPSTPAEPLPLSISGSNDVEVVPLGDSEQFVVVDGGVREEEARSTVVWLVGTEGAWELGRFDGATSGLQGSQMPDGAVHVVGVECEDSDYCMQVPMVRYRVDRDGVERHVLELQTEASVWSPVNTVGDEQVVVAWARVGPAGRPQLEPRLHRLALDGSSSEIGTIEARSPVTCPIEGGLRFYPRNNPTPVGEMVVQEFRDGELRTIGPVATDGGVPADTVNCGPDGEGEVALVDDTTIRVLDVRDGAVVLEDVPRHGPPPDDVLAALERHEDVYLRWVILDSSERAFLHELQVWTDGEWVEWNQLRSIESPNETQISGGVALTDVYSGSGARLELVRPA